MSERGHGLVFAIPAACIAAWPELLAAQARAQGVPLSAVIASPSSRAYFALMSPMILRLFTLLALVLMPFGMGAAGAAPVHHAPVTAAAQPCDEHGGQPAEQSRDEAMDCAVSCSMIAVAAARVDTLSVDHPVLTARPPAERGTGLHPDTATPPPKLS